MHTLYDIETQVPTFFHITPARVHDLKAMDAIPYEENSFYIFDRGYNDFKRLHNIESIGAYFVVRGKKNNDFKPERWKRTFDLRDAPNRKYLIDRYYRSENLVRLI